MRYGTFVLLLIFVMIPDTGFSNQSQPSDRATLTGNAVKGVDPSILGKTAMQDAFRQAAEETKDEGEKETYKKMDELLEGQKGLEKANQQANQNGQSTCQGDGKGQSESSIPPGAGQPPQQQQQQKNDDDEKPQQQPTQQAQQVPPAFQGQIAQIPQANTDTRASTSAVNNITNSALQAIRGSKEIADMSDFRAAR